jgi:cell division protein FtsW (lipid II flippase)
MTGTIRLVVGFILVFGAVGGMENPDQADYLIEQALIAVAGLALMLWATRDINRRADQTIDSLGR